MTTFYYWPYDEVTAELIEDQTRILLTTPWMQASLHVTSSNRSVAIDLVEKFKTGSLSGQDLNVITGLFEQVRQYPFCYTLPAPKGQGAVQPLDHPEVLDREWLPLSPLDLLLATIKNSPDATDLPEAEIRLLFRQLGRQEWEWDAEAAMDFAAVGQGIHPESLFSVIRRFHLLEVMENDKGSEIFQKIEALPEASFRIAASLLVRQNHYVTEKCQESLAAALETSGQARPLVTAFMAEEKGHDRILGVALKAMTASPENIPVTLATRTLMHLLKYVAGRNFLAFAMVVDIFERSSFESVDPLARLLAKRGYETAARYINRHKEINDAGEHENVGAGFLHSMAPCDRTYAHEAIRLAELVSLIFNGITASAWGLIRENCETL